MFGVADKLGSLDVGKKATIVVSKGDIMDYTTHRVIYEFIGGRLINLENKQTELNRKYKNRKTWAFDSDLKKAASAGRFFYAYCAATANQINLPICDTIHYLVK